MNANKYRLHALVFFSRNSVRLSSRNLNITWLSRKLDWKCLGKFKVVQQLSPYAYKVQLLETMKVHPIFHVSLIEPTTEDPLPCQVSPPPLPVQIDEEEEYKVQQILNIWEYEPWKKSQDLVRWTGYDHSFFEPAENLEQNEAITKFCRSYLQKPEPWRKDINDNWMPQKIFAYKGGAIVTALYNWVSITVKWKCLVTVLGKV